MTFNIPDLRGVGERRLATTTHITSIKLFGGNTENSISEPVSESGLNSDEKKQNNQPSRPQQLKQQPGYLKEYVL